MKIKNHYIYTRKKSPFYYVRFTLEDGRFLVKGSKVKTPPEGADHKKVSAALRDAGDFAVCYMQEHNERAEKERARQHSLENSISLKEYATGFFDPDGPQPH